MADYGAFALRLALAVAGLGIPLALAAMITRRAPLLEAARRCVIAIAVLLLISTGALVAAFLEPAGVPMRLKYVWAHSSRDMPGFYKLAALWGGMAGSLLFWAALLGLLAALAFLKPIAPRRIGTEGGALATTLFVEFFFLGLMQWVDGCQPFEKLPFPVDDGKGLNPLLQHPAMAIHPPLLYAGFVALTMPFAYAMGALMSGELGKEWIVRCRRWTIFGWTILSVGIVLGGYWAYVELGWGGVWAWDPVENASLLPWLVMTAFLHSVMIQEHRGMLKVWNMGLVIAAFLTTIFATFLTRSGVLNSVHTFALNKGIFVGFLGFIGFVTLLGGALILYRVSTGELRSERKLESFLSREFAFLANNVLFVTLTLTVLSGTLYPVISEQFFGHKRSLGPPWFNLATIPQFLLLLILLGIGPLIAWRKASAKSLFRDFSGPALAGLAVFGGALIWIRTAYATQLTWFPALAAASVFGGCAFVLGTMLLEIARGMMARRKRHEESVPVAFWMMVTANRRRYGGYFVHLAVLLVMIGFCAHTAFKVVDEQTLRIGQSMDVGAYTLKYESRRDMQAPEYAGLQAQVALRKDGKYLDTLVTESRSYRASDSAQTSEVALYKTLLHDVYVVAVAHPDDAQGPRTTFLVHINPLIDLIFLGTGMLVLGSLFAAWPSGRRRKRVGALKLSKHDLEVAA